MATTNVPVTRTVELDPATAKFPITITDKGTPDGWIKYVPKDGKTLVNDRWGLTEGTPVCRPDDPVKYGRFLKETFLPAAELLRD